MTITNFSFSLTGRKKGRKGVRGGFALKLNEVFRYPKTNRDELESL